ncbi:MAG: TonB-dependent receptor [Runella slithyformis]|nr:MAG: TonB-dependent receptor [Runella slithyformis]TAF45288.1 MAG: TonB-dependent receptor [Runella slithyformis]
MRKILLLFCLATLLGMTAAVAQTIKGKITDQAGLPLVGATAQIVGTTQGAVANRDGLFEIPNVGAGTYKVKISFIGYQSVTQDAQAGQMLTITLNDDALDMNEVVVTGSFDPRSKLESSVAITTLNARNIDMRAPRGTGDLLQSVPGMFVDNSAGEVGNRVIARGLSPVGNDQIGFTYVSLQEEGLPVMGAQMGFAVVDMYHRTDLTTARMESIRGGSSSIVAPNAPGGIFNFISKTGGPVFSGSGRLTAGVYNNGNNIGRFDAEFGGPLAKGWGYHVGGFYRNDAGARSTPFAANVGGQIKANITKQFKRGVLKFYGKYLKDQNTFFKEIALQNDLQSGFTGGTDPVSITNSTTFIDVTSPVPLASEYRPGAGAANPNRIFDAKKGIQNRTYAVGVDYQTDLGKGWGLNVKAKHSRFDQDYIQYQGNITLPVVPSLIIPNNQGYLQFGAGALGSAGTYIGANVPQPFAGQLSGSFLPSLLSPTYYDAQTGEVLAKVNFALQGGLPVGVLDPNVPNKLGKYLLATAPLNMFNQTTDNIAALNFNKEIGKHSLSFGTFYSQTQISTQWFADGVLSTIGANPRPVRVEFPAPRALPAAVAGVPSLAAAFGPLYGTGNYQATDRNGMVLHSGLAYTVTENTSTLNSLYLNDVIQATDKLSIDVGLRYETVRQTGNKQGWRGGTAVGGLGGLDGNPFTTFDLGSRVYNGRVFDYDKSYNADGTVANADVSGDGDGFQFSYLNWSAGVNYKLTDKSAMYVRVSRGNKAPELDYYANNFVNIPLDKKGAIETSTQAELGYKVASKKASLSVTGFYSELKNALLQLFISNGAASFFTDATFNSTRTLGLELETVLQPTDKFNIRAHATIQSAKYTKLLYQQTAGSVVAADFFFEDFSGNTVKDIAPVMIDVTPSYKIGKFSPYLNYRYFSKRMGNRRNTIELPAYGVVSAGIMADLSNHFNVSVQASNLLNSAGILLYGGYGLQGTTAEDLAVGGVKRPDGTVIANTDITVLNTLGAPSFARPILARQLTFAVTYKF